jgi:hypothetical protein
VNETYNILINFVAGNRQLAIAQPLATIKTEIMNRIEFIKRVLISEIKKIQQDEGHHYISFGLISQGIEFLGYCLDETENKSSKRFNKAITDLFPDDYNIYVKRRSTEQFDLYGNLRCGLLHIFIPGKDIELIQEAEIDDYGEHLEIKNLRGRGRLILVSQKLFTHFENACKDLIIKIQSGEIENKEILSTSPTD